MVKSVQGIGDNLAVRVIAELCDIARFKKKNELVTIVGLNT
ncbi:transposase [uncultured Catenibacterium sp.]